MSALPPTAIPPHDLDAERAVLGLVLIDAEVRPRVIALQPADFYLEGHRLIYGAMRRLDDRNEPIDPITLAAELRRAGDFECVGGELTLALLMEQASIAVYFDAYVDLIRNAAMKRNLIQVVTRAQQDAYGGVSAGDLLRSAKDGLDRLEADRLGPEMWPDPEAIASDLAPVPTFDRRLLPAALVDWASDIAARAQCPLDYVAVGAIVSLAAVVGRKCGIRPKRHDDWTVVPNLWGMVVGRPGVLKSPALAEAMRPLRRLITDAQELHEQERAKYRATLAEQKAQREVLEAKLKKAVKKGADVEQIKAELVDLKEDDPPVERRYATNDTTIEKLGELLNENPNGLMVYRDELTGFLATMDRQGHESDRAFYLEAWNGTDAFTYDRIGRGTLHIRAACVSILGSIQPGPLTAYLCEAFGGGRDDGFIQRFQLAVYPDTAQEWTNVDRWPNSEAKTRAFAVFKALDAPLDAQALGMTQEESEATIPYLRFCADAQEFFDGWRADLEARLRSDNDHPVIVSHLAKFRSLMPSLALIFHLVDVAGCNDAPDVARVSLHSTRCAAAWCDFLEAHARRIYQSVTAHTDTSARLLSTKIRTGKTPEIFTLRAVLRKGWAGLTVGDDVLRGLDLLEELQWVRREEIRPVVGRPTVHYHVNPKARGAA